MLTVAANRASAAGDVSTSLTLLSESTLDGAM